MGLLPEPLMYLSGYLKQHQREYFRLLSAVRTDGDWEAWVSFFVEAVEAAANEAERAIVAIASLVTADRRRLLTAPRVGAVALRLFELLPVMRSVGPHDRLQPRPKLVGQERLQPRRGSTTS